MSDPVIAALIALGGVAITAISTLVLGLKTNQRVNALTAEVSDLKSEVKEVRADRDGWRAKFWLLLGFTNRVRDGHPTPRPDWPPELIEHVREGGF